MEIQSSALGYSLDTFGTAGSQTGAKDDMFSQMIARMMDTSSTKRQESTERADSRRAAARSASQDDQASRAAEKARAAKEAGDKAAADRSESQRAAEKTDARARLAAPADPILPQPAADIAPRGADTDRPARPDADRPAAAKPANKPEAKANSGKAADKPANTPEAKPDATVKDAPVADDTAEDTADATAPALDGEVLTDDPSADDTSKTVVIEAQITIVETTVEVITPAQHFAMTLTQGTGNLSVSTGTSEGEGANDAIGTATDGVEPAALAAAQAAAGRQADAGQHPTAAPGPQNVPTDPKALHPQGEAKPDATPDAVAPDTAGALNADALPTDESVQLPESFADLFQNAGQNGGTKEAASKGQNGGNTPHGQQQQPQPFADPTALNPQTTAGTATAAATKTAFEAVAATLGADTAQPVAATHDTDPTDPTQAVMAPLDGVKTTTAADGTRATATLHPSRGTAAMPQGVPDQITVNIQKAVKDGKDHFSIRLNPEDLGRIDIRLEIAQDGRLQANISVEKAQTLELLQRDQRSLESALNSAGVKADSGSLNFSLHSDGQPFAGENSGQGAFNRRGRGSGATNPDEQAEQDAAIIHTLTLGPGRFDVRV